MWKCEIIFKKRNKAEGPKLLDFPKKMRYGIYI